MIGEKMEIRVCAIDSKLANLAILKIAQYHINCGDNVRWYEPLFDTNIDIFYISKIFTFTEDLQYFPNCEVFKGGTGYDLTTVLPYEIENITDIQQAYTLLYPKIDYSFVFTTRGCVNQCPFCVVPQKEGFIHDVELTSLNPNGEYIQIMDNSFFAFKTWKRRLDLLKSFNQPLDFTQGIDIRILTEEQAIALGNCNIKAIHIAWDNLIEEKQVRRGIERLIKYVSPSKITCYVLVGFEQKEIIESDLYRVFELHKYRITPFAMGYIDFDNPNHRRSLSVRRFQRYVNKHVFKSVDWKDYGNNFKAEKQDQETSIYDFIGSD